LADLFDRRARRPSSGINFVTAHDGFTLADLVTYEHKHTRQMARTMRERHNEITASTRHRGSTEDAGIDALRRRHRRNLLATLLFSQGTPMLLGGDEFGAPARQQQRLLQDNEISWLHWKYPPRNRNSCPSFAC